MLEAQAPRWEPGSHLGYHAITFGHLVGEVIRRATGRTVGQTFREEMVEPLALQAWIGLPEDAHPDLARLERTPVELREFVEELIGPGTSWSRAMIGTARLGLRELRGEPLGRCPVSAGGMAASDLPGP